MIELDHDKTGPVIHLLLRAGWRPDGEVDVQVKVLSRFGGAYRNGCYYPYTLKKGVPRPRFKFGKYNRVTVGPRTVCFYKVRQRSGRATDFVRCKPTELIKIRQLAVDYPTTKGNPA